MLTKNRETQQSEARTRTSAPMMDREGEGEFRTPRSGSRLEQLSPIDIYSRRHKRLKVNEGKIGSVAFEAKYKRRESLSDVVDYSDPFFVPNLEEELSRGMYGSASKEILELQARKIRLFNSISALYPSLSIHRPNLSPQTPKSDDRLNTGNTEVPESADRRSGGFESQNVIDVDDDCMIVDAPSSKDSRFSFRSSRETEESVGSIQHPTGKHDAAGHVQVSNAQNGLEDLVILDSDEEDLGEQGTCNSTSTDALCHEVRGCPDESRWQETVATETVISTVPDASQQASYQYQEVFLKKPTDEKTIKDFADKNVRESKVVKEQQSLTVETEVRKDKGAYLGVQDDIARKKSDIRNGAEDELSDVWREMTLALEFTKDATEEAAAVEGSGEEDEGCDHSFFLKDDLGYVCRVCGLIQKSIETIFDYQWGKVKKSTRTYMHESRESKDRGQNYATLSGLNISQQNLAVAEISVHPRHMKQMKAHQLEGFNFLARNLVADEPGGCILAHAPGSGKTFMIISFVQSFLARYPNARPLVVLPKGIIDTWKKEFKKWQIEDLPLYDLYSSKAEKRSEQLEILKEWVDHKGVMFLGYKQFSNIVCSSASDKVVAACHDILLKVPTILILDEGHTPRNDETDVLNSLAKVQTPRKVVLSGTLFQNHVKEVFTILNLVRPKFLKLDSSKAIKRRIMSRVQISGGRRQLKAGGGDPSFYELVEETLQHDENFGRKVTVIHDLREMTSRVLHYYKGDFLDELPGLVDFTVLLNLSAKQKHQVEKLKKMEKFKRNSLGSAVYLHPQLKEFSETALLRDKGSNFEEAKMDNLLNTLDVRDGVKAKFFLNILALCESSGEKLLVFSQYLLPLKFLEKLVLKNKGWRPGKEVFIISGDSNTEQREWSTEQFNSSSDAKVLFGSIKACGEGISLVGASRVIVLDVHLNPSVTRQAVGRAFRPGQVRKVYIYRLVAAESPEEEDHQTSFRKELISKMWFEWSECYGQKDFQMDSVDPKETNDVFWGSPLLGEDVKLLYTR